MLFDKIRLGVSGRLSDKELMSKFRLVLDYSPSKESEIILLCDFSRFDIPIGYVFNGIEDINGDLVFRGAIVLKKVTQQFVLPFDSLPQGWKSICKFEFLQNDIPEIVRSLPATSYWVNADVSLVLKGDVLVDALQ